MNSFDSSVHFIEASSPGRCIPPKIMVSRVKRSGDGSRGGGTSANASSTAARKAANWSSVATIMPLIPPRQFRARLADHFFHSFAVYRFGNIGEINLQLIDGLAGLAVLKIRRPEVAALRPVARGQLNEPAHGADGALEVGFAQIAALQVRDHTQNNLARQ